MKHGWAHALPLVLVAILSGCTSNDTRPSPTTGSSGMMMDGHDHGGMMANGTMMPNDEMYTVATDISSQPEGLYKFRPNSFSAHVGDVLNITLKNAVGNQYSHSLVIDQLGVKIGPIPQEQAASKILKLEKAGTYTFYCDQGQHRQLGMTGTLTVS